MPDKLILSLFKKKPVCFTIIGNKYQVIIFNLKTYYLQLIKANNVKLALFMSRNSA